MYNGGLEKVNSLMRIGFISDIHGNFTALQAVLEDMKAQSVDEIICLGDTISLGPQPLEVLNTLRELKCTIIQGNHDATMLDPEKAADFQITDYLVPAFHWAREILSKEDMDFIGTFKRTHEFTFPNGMKLLAFHGSPESTTDIIQALTPTERLDELFGESDASIFIGGHSHIQMHRRYGKKLILNSGSVGNAFEYVYDKINPPKLLHWAEYAILEQGENSFHTEMRRVNFDIPKLVEIVRESKVPGGDWWIEQYTG